MRVPYKPVMLTKGPFRYKYIIIHDINCIGKNNSEFKVDRNFAQIGKLRSRLKIEKKYDELPYHYVCEKVGDDYETFASRPLQFSCEFPDINYSYTHFAVHILVMGNFNILAGETRMYQQMCYRVISPMIRFFKIPRNNIILHGEISRDQLDCPGFNFDKHQLKSFLTPFIIMQ